MKKVAMINGREKLLNKFSHKLKKVYLHITNKCNLKCIHCYLSCNSLSGNEKRELPMKQICNLSEGLERMGIDELIIEGGEPILHRNFWNILDAIKVRKFNKTVITNTSQLTSSDVAKLSHLINTLSVSIDGKKSTHDYIRQSSGLYNHAQTILEEAMRTGVKIRILCTACAINKNELTDLIHIFNLKGIERINFLSLSQKGHGMKNLRELWIPPEEWINICKAIDNIKENREIQINIVYGPGVTYKWDPPDLSYQGCNFWRKNVCNIDWDGNVYFCGMFIGTKIILGNIKKNAIDSIFQSVERWELLKNTMGLSSSDCLNCNHWTICHGGCLAYATNFGNIPFDKDPRCSKKLLPLCPFSGNVNVWRE